jgi:uncharacterized protein (TIGR02145 family)
MNSRNVCPDGWHIPSEIEWITLINYLRGDSIAGEKLRETGTEHWSSPNNEATNESGFPALPGGLRFYDGLFNLDGRLGYWWTSSEENKDGMIFTYRKILDKTH